MERLMRRLNGSLSRSVCRSTQDIFQQSPLDLRFALQKTLDPRVTHTRASSATFVDSSGVLRSAVTNLLLRSEEFDNASWTVISGAKTVTPNTTVAPNGTLTADTVTADGTSGAAHFVDQTVTLTAIPHVFTVYAKAGTNNFIQLRLSSALGNRHANFDVSTGATGTSGSITSSSVQPVGNGWYRCSMVCTPTAAAGTLAIIVVSSNSAISGETNALNTSVILWGAQLEQSATVGEYIPTTSAINSAPRFDHNPTTGESLGLLVEEARTNSIANNTMVGAVAGTPGTNPTGWAYATTSSNGLTLSIVGTGVENGINYIDYRFNGTTVASPAGCAISVVNATAATGQTWTASTYWKLAAGTATGITSWQIGIIESTSAGAFVTGAFYSQTAPTSAALITQRPVATRTLSGGATVGLVSCPFNINVAGNTAIDFTLRIGLPQLELGAFATSVIPTTTSTVTRAADVASITGSNFGVTRTNILSRSEEIGVAPWNLGATTVSPNAIASPTGTLTADSILETSSLLEHNVYPDAIFLSAVQYTFSAYVKANGRSSVGLRHYFAATNWVSRIFSLVGAGSVTQSSAGTTSDVTSVGQSIVNVGNDWYRLSLTFTSPTARGAYVSIDGCTTTTPTLSAASGTEIYTGDVTKGYYMWGAQLETGPTATAYIPTTTAAVSVFESSFYNQTASTIYTEAASYSGAAYTGNIYGFGTSFNDSITHYRQVDLQPVARVRTAGVDEYGAIGNGAIWTGTSLNKFALALATTSGRQASNGALTSGSDDSSIVFPTVSSVSIGSAFTAGHFNGTIKRLTYWPTRLGNEVLQRITQP